MCLMCQDKVHMYGRLAGSTQRLFMISPVTCPAYGGRSTDLLVAHLGGRVLHGQSPKKPQNKWQSRSRQKLFPDVSIQTAKQTRAHQQPGNGAGNLLMTLVCLNKIFQECDKESLRANLAQKAHKNEHLNRSRKVPEFYSG